MKHLVRMLLLLVLFSVGEAFAVCACQNTNELCTEMTVQSAVGATHEHPFIQPVKLPEPRSMQVLVWDLAIVIAIAAVRRSLKSQPGTRASSAA